MPKAIYALLVGIDLYPSPIPRLYGCVNDIQAFKGYLEGRVAGSNDVVLDSIELLNEQATRAAVIVGFRKVLSRAKLGGCRTLLLQRPWLAGAGPRAILEARSPTGSTRPSSFMIPGPRTTGTSPTRSWPS